MGNNADARARLARLSKDLRALPRVMALEAAPEAAAKLKEVLDANIAAGVGPDGKAWPLRQDGGKALQNAAEALTVTAVDTVILARLTGPEALHHLGRARGHVQRLILPTKFIPQPVVVAITATLADKYPQLLGLR